MRNLKIYTSEAEVAELTSQIFRTPEIKTALKEQPLLRSLINDFCARPRVTFEVSEPSIERGNFTSWYNALALRTYENPAVGDVYYLHEMAHIATMPYSGAWSFEKWNNKMLINEMEASVISEAYVYLLCPALRAKTFKSEIWVDRFLRAGLPEPMAFAELMRLREQAQLHPKAEDKNETRIAHYLGENKEWTRIWSRRHIEIETHMEKFNTLAAIDRTGAAQMHLEWIKRNIQDSARPYPFADEVQAFAAYCAKDKSHYLDDLKLKTAV